MVHPMLGEVIAIIEFAVILIVIGTALFGSETLSERAFRLLRWFSNRPEPPGPIVDGAVGAPDHPAWRVGVTATSRPYAG